MVIRISDKTQNYSKVTKLLVKPIIIFGIKHKIIEHITETLLDKNTFEKSIINSPINTDANNPIKIALDNNCPYVNKFGNRGAIPNCTLTSQPAKPYIEKIIY